MAISKIILNGVTQMDVTQDTVASSNLLSGETATGADGNQVVGAYVPASATIQSLNVTPSETQQTFNSSSVDGYKPVTVGAVSSSYVGSGVTRRSPTDMTVSGGTVTAPAGYYESASSKAVATGTEGAPTATKGTVSNHSVSVTPSVTNSAGYISGGTKTGTAVSVSASELVSGNLPITSNGNNIDVTNYSTVSVNVASTVQTDTKTVTASNYPTSLEFTGLEGEPKMFTVRLNTAVSSSGSTTYYYIVDITSHGTTTHGNCFRIGSTRQVTTLSSGYSWSYSGTTLTITSSAESRSASPGAFYSGSYELMYVY